MRSRRANVLAKGLPCLVLQAQTRVQGFADCNGFKPQLACRCSAKEPLDVAPDACSQGLGSALLGALCGQAERAGLGNLLAVMGDLASAGSVAVHAA